MQYHKRKAGKERTGQVGSHTEYESTADKGFKTQ